MCLSVMVIVPFSYRVSPIFRTLISAENGSLFILIFIVPEVELVLSVSGLNNDAAVSESLHDKTGDGDPPGVGGVKQVFVFSFHSFGNWVVLPDIYVKGFALFFEAFFDGIYQHVQ